ncbi:MAG: HAD-IIIA family hydrolase [Bdellovibrionales bacterium]
MNKTVAIIPARGGSKGIPRKNLKNICGFPLIYWSIEAAKAVKDIHEVYVSTEDAEIAEVAQKYGAKVLHRPAELARDDSTTLQVLAHCLKEVNAQTLVILQPTSPVRKKATLAHALENFFSGDYDSLATGYVTKQIEYGSHQNLRRQDIKGFFYDDGNIYIHDRKVIEAGRWSGEKIFKMELSREEQYEIDDEVDFYVVEQLLRQQLHAGQISTDFLKRLRQIRLFVSDVDGVMTDGGMFYDNAGGELKKFNTLDGKAIELLRECGLKVAIMTGESTDAVERRAKKLKFDFLYQGCTSKESNLEQLLKRLELKPHEVLFVGDDLGDLNVMKQVGVAVTVPNAVQQIKEISHFMCSKKGGDGALRDIAEWILLAHESGF